MKIRTTKEKLLAGIQLAERLAGRKESLPVLSCILFDTDRELVIRATNLEAGIEVRVPCEIEAPGQIAVPAQIISQTIKSVAADTVTLITDDAGNMMIESRGSKTTIKGIPHDEFPRLSGAEDAGGCVVPRELLLRGLHSVMYAASPSMIRPELGSIYISLKPGTIVTVATDSFRLAEKTIAAPAVRDERDLLIPLKHATELAYVLERLKDEDVTLCVEEAQLTVDGGGVRFVSRVVEGNFPDYKAIIPASPTTEAILLKGDFVEMLRKARVFAGDDQQVGLHAHPQATVFSATARSPKVGEMADTLEAKLTGEDIDINFHINYLSDCLSTIPSDSLSLSFSGPGRALVMRGANDSSFMYLVMPLNR